MLLFKKLPSLCHVLQLDQCFPQQLYPRQRLFLRFLKIHQLAQRQHRLLQCLDRLFGACLQDFHFYRFQVFFCPGLWLLPDQVGQVEHPPGHNAVEGQGIEEGVHLVKLQLLHLKTT